MVLIVAGVSAQARELRAFGFKNGAHEDVSKVFSPLVGTWHMDRDGAKPAYAVDGRNWELGVMSAGAKEKARSLYGDRYSEFLNGLEPYRYFPLSVCKEVKDFKQGAIEVSFKTLSGRIDQAAGIAFDIKPTGEYLVIRANALENNLVLFRMQGGRRSTVEWIRNVPTPANQWHTLKVVVAGGKIEGYLNNRKLIDYTWREKIEGRVGLWSKADSYVLFDNFTVEP